MSSLEVGQYRAFSYTGTVQEFVVPVSGIYQLTCVGGSTNGNRGGKGGTSSGYIKLKKGTVIYVCVGGNGNSRYNGGGAGAYHGGGATHMAFMTGTLTQIGVANLDKILIVAGGGGGRYYDSNCNTGGGAGGGLSGGAGETETDYPYGANYGGAGGTQSGGYAFGQGQSCGSNAGAGGGGLFGGRAGQTGCGGGGGSGYIGGVPEFSHDGVTYKPTTTIGSGNSSAANGSASIKLVAEVSMLTMYLGDKQIPSMYLGASAVTKLVKKSWKPIFNRSLDVASNLLANTAIGYMDSAGALHSTWSIPSTATNPTAALSSNYLDYSAFYVKSPIDLTDLHRIRISYEQYTTLGTRQRTAVLDVSKCKGSGYLTVIFRSHAGDTFTYNPRIECYVCPTPATPRTNSIYHNQQGVYDEGLDVIQDAYAVSGTYRFTLIDISVL